MKYVIVGAVAGGASVAARLRRLDEHARIVIFERGEFMSYANCGLPYYIGEVIKKRDKLFVQTAAAFHGRFNIEVRTKSDVLSIDRTAKTVTVRNLLSGEVYTEQYDKLVLSPGADPVRPPLPGINLPGIFTLRNVADTDLIKEYTNQYGSSGRAVVVGAGFIGLEMAENLHKLGMQVTIVEMGNQVLAPLDFEMAAVIQQHIRSKGVDLYLKTAVNGFRQQGAGIAIALNNGTELEADIVILSIGVRPENQLAAAAGLEIGKTRGIVVNEYLQTSDADIYALGDAIEFPNPVSGVAVNTLLAGPANKQGRIVANNLAMGNKFVYKGSINTAILQVFDMVAGSAGMSAKALVQAGIPHIVSTTHHGSHAGYYPGAQQLTIQLAFAPETGILLGAQVVGFGGVDKRLDVLSGIIQQQGSIFDLEAFEQSYAPPFSSAKDPVNMAGFAAENILTSKLKVTYWNKMDADALILDVRTTAEFEQGHMDGAINIPVDVIRKRMEELDSNSKIIIYCQQGLRGYLAHRILAQNGFTQIWNLSGGYQLWEACTTESALINIVGTLIK